MENDSLAQLTDFFKSKGYSGREAVEKATAELAKIRHHKSKSTSMLYHLFIVIIIALLYCIHLVVSFVYMKIYVCRKFEYLPFGCFLIISIRMLFRAYLLRLYSTGKQFVEHIAVGNSLLLMWGIFLLNAAYSLRCRG
jgi:hypothetical protein